MSTNTNNKTNRPPIVTVMGHVDHGKTSILDAIRSTNIQNKEFGGITQHIGAYQISHDNKKITFIDTPGHEAFSSMRSRGGKVADIVVLVVAADEGVKPQTTEAINLALSTNTPIIVAINKVDKPEANVQNVKKQLSQNGILTEDWGGDVICVELSAKTKKGLNDLLDNIVLLSELLDIKANTNHELEAIVIEAKLDRKKGPLVSCIVLNGTLNVKDMVFASNFNAKVRSITDDKGKSIKTAMPGDPVEILGFKQVPNVGDLIVEQQSELAELSLDQDRQEILGKNTKKTLSIVLKADTQGTLEAVKASLAQLVTSSVGLTYSIKFLSSSTGDITESDILMASSAKGLIIGFNVKANNTVLDFAVAQKVQINLYNTIYKLVEETEEFLKGTAFSDETKIKGRAKVLKIFKLPSGDLVAGSVVLAGSLKPNMNVNIYTKNPNELTPYDLPVYTGKIKKLKKGKQDTDIVGKDVECGVLLKPVFEDIKPDMFIEVIQS